MLCTNLRARGSRNENSEAVGKVFESRDHSTLHCTLYLTRLLTTLTDTFRGFYIIRAAVKSIVSTFRGEREFFKNEGRSRVSKVKVSRACSRVLETQHAAGTPSVYALLQTPVSS